MVAYLAATPGVDKVTPAGSLRRGKETVGDLDLLVTGPAPEAALDRFVAHPRIGEVLGKGPNKASAKVGLQSIQVDVRALPAESYGAAMQYFTGSKEHNIALRGRCLKMGYTLSEYGLFQLEGEAKVAGETEEDVYRKLGLAWIPPELRENQGEIDAAAEGRLPRLVERSDIRGDLHMHTTETDGRASLEEMAAAARELGYEYIAITDHSQALAMANGLDEARVVAFARRVREMDQSGLGIRVFSGIECDIRKDGAMDLADDALAELDFVIGSVHSYMNQEAAEMTDRLLRALECPHIRALGHPTGRLLLVRDAFPFDFDRVAARSRAAEGRHGDQRQPRAARSARHAAAAGQGSRRPLRHLDRRAPPQASAQHALRRHHGAARLAGSVRCHQYATIKRVRAASETLECATLCTATVGGPSARAATARSGAEFQLRPQGSGVLGLIRYENSILLPGRLVCGRRSIGCVRVSHPHREIQAEKRHARRSCRRTAPCPWSPSTSSTA